MDATEAKRRLESGESATILDSRNPNAWDSSDTKIVGAEWINPHNFRPDPSWSNDRLTLVY
jgi:hypothetical protein